MQLLMPHPANSTATTGNKIYLLRSGGRDRKSGRALGVASQRAKITTIAQAGCLFCALPRDDLRESLHRGAPGSFDGLTQQS